MDSEPNVRLKRSRNICSRRCGCTRLEKNSFIALISLRILPQNPRSKKIRSLFTSFSFVWLRFFAQFVVVDTLSIVSQHLTSRLANSAANAAVVDIVLSKVCLKIFPEENILYIFCLFVAWSAPTTAMPSTVPVHASYFFPCSLVCSELGWHCRFVAEKPLYVERASVNAASVDAKKSSIRFCYDIFSLSLFFGRRPTERRFQAKCSAVTNICTLCVGCKV